MNYCTGCGKKIENDSKYCVNCGKEVNGNRTIKIDKKEEKLEKTEILNDVVEEVKKDNLIHYTDQDKILYILLGFFLPLVGLILFFMWIDTRNNEAGKNALKGALAKLFVYFVAIIVIALNVALGGGTIINNIRNRGNNTQQTNPGNWDNFA